MKRKILLFIFTLVLVLTGITNINAYDKYDGDYTIEYLLKNYNVVTLGTKERYNYSIMGDIEKTKGSVTNVFDIGGPVLIRGNYTGSTNLKWDNEFAQKTNCIPSYIKGHIGDKIKAGSIESAELSNIYVGSSNKVTNNDGYYTVNNDTYKYKYPVKVSDDYVDFDKLYASIVNEQGKVEIGTVLSDSNYGTIVIDKPGVYTIKDLSDITSISIKNYDPLKLYLINIDSDYIYAMPHLSVADLKMNGDEIYSGRQSTNDIYSGNIIWNFKNARYLHTNYETIGHIVAPKADIELTESYYPGTIIANSITSGLDKYTAIQFYPYNLDNKIVSSELHSTIVEEKEINNDIYNGNYSIDELLKNYSVVTLGTKDYSNDAKLKSLTNAKGTANIFHIAGQFLINGNLGVESINYLEQKSGDYGGIRLDLKYINESANSYIKGLLSSNAYDSYFRGAYIYSWTRKVVRTLSPSIYVGSNNSIYNWEDSYWSIPFNYDKIYYTDYLVRTWGLLGPMIQNKSYKLETIHSAFKSNNYIDFTILYNSIAEQQKKIDKGTIVRPDENNEIHIPIGGNYTIEGINETSRIIFDNYNENKDKLTIVTINDEGSINMPFEDSDSWSNISTNDWYGKTKELYPINPWNTDVPKIQPETYYGNIVFNIPNARYIKLAGGNSFKGHIIAPNADVETPEMNFAGAMIVNSLYTEGHTEAHFYPLTVGSVGTGIKKETKTIGGEVEKITISGTKTWDDNNNQDGLRPESVTINLLANGEKVDSVTITEKDNWKYSFNVPRVDENGIKINYTITEDAIEHYATKIESFSNDTCPSGCKVSIDGYNITNSYTPKKTSLTVNKVWKDENNADKLRPKSVEVELYANGKRVSSATLNEENNWTYIFNEIDMNENGKRIEYTVKEKEKIKGYTTSISGDQETGYTITNTHVVKKVNPTTGDNIRKFLSISIMSLILLSGCVLILMKYRNKKA